MEFSYEYTEKSIAVSRQGVVLQFVSLAAAKIQILHTTSDLEGFFETV
jgi:hypothetical protein